MSYQVITDFRGGLDARKYKLSLPPGTLTKLVNGHITPGGEIEKRKAFIPTTLPDNTYGPCPVPAGIMVFGSIAAPNMPAGFYYTQLIHPDGSTAMSSVVASCLNGDYPLVVAKFADGQTFTYYNGALVTDFTDGLVLPHLNTNAKLTAALTGTVNQSGLYTAIQNASPNDTELDVFSQPGNSYAANVIINSACNITLTTTDDSGFTGAVVTSTNGLNTPNGKKLTMGGKTYTFNTVLSTGPTVEGEVLIGGTIAATVKNLYNAINHTGTPGTDYTAAVANSVVYAQNLVTAGTPSFQVMAWIKNTDGAIQNNLAGVNYETDAPTVARAVAVKAVGQFKVSAMNPGAVATGQITTNGTEPGNGDSVTVGNIKYTFKTTFTGGFGSPNEILRTGSSDATLDNLVKAINGIGTVGINYSLGTKSNNFAYAGARIGSGSAAAVQITALNAGSDGNSIVLSDSGPLITPGFLTGGVTARIESIVVGKVFASGKITTNGTNLSDGNTVIIGGTTYTFRNTLAATNDVKIGANANTTLQNLIQAINGTGILYYDYIIANVHPQVTALPTLSSGILQINARQAGAAQNVISLATNSSNLTLSGTTLTGGADGVSVLNNVQVLAGTGNQPNGTGGATVTVGGQTYIFKTTMTVAYDVQIGATADATLDNLIKAINASGTAGTTAGGANYYTGTLVNPYAVASARTGTGATATFNVTGIIANGTLVKSGTNILKTSTPELVASGYLFTPIITYAGSTLTSFCTDTINAINAYSETSGYTAKLIGNTIYLYTKAGNSLSNDADITVTVAGQVAIGFCSFLITNGVNPNSNTLGTIGNNSFDGTNNQPLQGKLVSLQVDGWQVNTYAHSLGTTNITGNISTGATVSKTISDMVTCLALDINANYPTAIFLFGLTCVPLANRLFLARLVTSSADEALNVNVCFNDSRYISAEAITQDDLVAVASPEYIGFLKYLVGSPQLNQTNQITAGYSLAELGLTYAGPLGFLGGAILGSAFGGLFSEDRNFKTADYSPIVATCQVTGGYPPYKYQWQKLSGVDGFVFSAPTHPSGTFYRKNTSGGSVAMWICRITDSLGNTVDSNPIKVKQP